MKISAEYTNTQCKPGKLVPKAIRLQVYRKAIELIKSGEHAFEMDSFSLCLLLPCILWNLITYMDDAPDAEDWIWQETPEMFRELQVSHIERIKYTPMPERDNVRIEILESFLTN